MKQPELNEESVTIKHLFAVRDKRIGMYFPPNPASHLTELVRALTEIVNNKHDHNFSKYPSDFELYKIGTFNEQTGEITAFVKPEFLHELSEFVIPGQS